MHWRGVHTGAEGDDHTGGVGTGLMNRVVHVQRRACPDQVPTHVAVCTAIKFGATCIVAIGVAFRAGSGLSPLRTAFALHQGWYVTCANRMA